MSYPSYQVTAVLLVTGIAFAANNAAKANANVAANLGQSERLGKDVVMAATGAGKFEVSITDRKFFCKLRKDNTQYKTVVLFCQTEHCG